LFFFFYVSSRSPTDRTRRSPPRGRGRPAAYRSARSSTSRHPRLAERLSDLRRVRSRPRKRGGEVGRGMSVALGDARAHPLRRRREAVGIAQGAIRLRRDYSQERIAFGPGGLRLPGAVKLRPGDAVTAARASCSTRPAPWRSRTIPSSPSTPRWRKLFASDTAMAVRSRAVQTGGLATGKEYPVERMIATRDHPELRGHQRDPARRDRSADGLAAHGTPPR